MKITNHQFLILRLLHTQYSCIRVNRKLKTKKLFKSNEYGIKVFDSTFSALLNAELIKFEKCVNVGQYIVYEYVITSDGIHALSSYLLKNKSRLTI